MENQLKYYELEMQKARELINQGDYIEANKILKTLENITQNLESILELRLRISTEIKEKFGLTEWAIKEGLDSEPTSDAYHQRAQRELEKAREYERAGKLSEAARFYAGACTGFLHSCEREQAEKIYQEKKELLGQFSQGI